MNMVKTILLGSATAFVAFAASAADLPRKSAPAPVCSFGAGFMMLPGTDTCLQISGNVMQHGYLNLGLNGAGQGLTTRSRANFTLDARTNTSSGILRSVLQFEARRGANSNSNDGLPNTGNNGSSPVSSWTAMTQAYVQFAGFTVGLADSPFNYVGFHSLATAGYEAPSVGVAAQLAYTASLGGGLTATLAAVDSRYTQVGQLGAAGIVGTTTAGVFTAGNAAVLGAISSYGVNAPMGGIGRGVVHGGGMVPDMVANIRMSQAWGSAQLMGATHYVRQTDTIAASAIGYAVGAGVTVNLPMLGAGDSLYLSAVYANGATNYVYDQGTQEIYSGITSSNNIAADAVTTAAGSMGLTNAIGVYGSVRHNFNSMMFASLYGAYKKVDLNAAATGTDWKQASVGANVQYSPVRNLFLGLEATYMVTTQTTQAGVAANGVPSFRTGYFVRRAF